MPSAKGMRADSEARQCRMEGEKSREDTEVDKLSMCPDTNCATSTPYTQCNMAHNNVVSKHKSGRQQTTIIPRNTTAFSQTRGQQDTYTTRKAALHAYIGCRAHGSRMTVMVTLTSLLSTWADELQVASRTA